ncbi:MAG: hypothetical protein JXR73_22405 [Candidatus Omnitrophica bacterium]|nr:hypothetical protein [Candidatus Omnitrophota bacterium]
MASVCFKAPAWACRYNVRDVGFVHFGSNPYTLYGYIDGSVSEERRTAVQQIPFAALLESNIDWELIDLDQDGEHPALRYLESKSLQSEPALILVNEDEEALPIPIQQGEESFRDNLWETLDDVVTSGMREKIVRDAIRTYGVIVMIDGQDEAENQRVHQIVQEVIGRVAENMSALPKEIDSPPVMHRITLNDFADEKVLLWSIKADAGGREPQVAVVYGRARRIGQVLTGRQITGKSLIGVVSMIGLSCECGLDRNWMMGVMIPFRWTSEHSEEMARQLEFDPDNPLVKTEISQILSISASRSGPSGLDGLLMGYSEIAVDWSPQNTAADANTDAESTPGAADAPFEEDASQESIRETSAVQAASSIGDSTFPSNTVSSKYMGAAVIAGGLLVISLLGGLAILLRSKG